MFKNIREIKTKEKGSITIKRIVIIITFEMICCPKSRAMKLMFCHESFKTRKIVLIFFTIIVTLQIFDYHVLLGLKINISNIQMKVLPTDSV